MPYRQDKSKSSADQKGLVAISTSFITMAKKSLKDRDAIRKGKLAKKQEIEKLVEEQRKKTFHAATKTEFVPTTSRCDQLVHLPRASNNTFYQSTTPQQPQPPHISTAHALPVASSVFKPLHLARQQTSVNQVADSQFYVVDRRHESRPNVPLVRLPKETDVPRHERVVLEGPFRFLDLPGEIRNKIYSYLFRSEHHEIRWLLETPKEKKERVKKDARDKQRRRALTYRMPFRQRVYQPHFDTPFEKDRLYRRRAIQLTNPRNPSPEWTAVMSRIYNKPSRMALLFVNRRVHDETSSLFYSLASFSFDLQSTLTHFLDRLLLPAKASIRTIHVSHQSYGPPARTINKEWKTRHDRAWDRLCWRISDELPSLAHLGLDLDYGKSPLLFPPLEEARYDWFATDWMMPLWAFQGIELKTCWLRIRSSIVDDHMLRINSRRLRKEILEEEWNERAEAYTKKGFYGTWLNGLKGFGGSLGGAKPDPEMRFNGGQQNWRPKRDAHVLWDHPALMAEEA